MRKSHTWRILAAIVLTAAATLVSALPASAFTTDYGSTSAANRTLRQGCHRYRYHYTVSAPTGDWMLETYLFDPRGKPRGTNDFVPGSDPATGYGHFGVCRSTVVPGRFTIRAQLTWYVPPSSPLGQPTAQTAWFEPTHFWMHRS
jgi:hypothetical protein